jgi:hypothetical protein
MLGTNLDRSEPCYAFPSIKSWADPCQSANRARWTRKRMWLPQGATKRNSRRPSVLEGFVVSGSVCASDLLASLLGMTSCCDQNRALLYFASHNPDHKLRKLDRPWG